MANAHTNSVALGGTLSGFLARISAAMNNYRMYLRTMEELRGLSDRELHDLGLSRFSIREVAREAIYGR